jgi:hypothetical protein
MAEQSQWTVDFDDKRRVLGHQRAEIGIDGQGRTRAGRQE